MSVVEVTWPVVRSWGSRVTSTASALCQPLLFTSSYS